MIHAWKGDAIDPLKPLALVGAGAEVQLQGWDVWNLQEC
jgi:hypothetical protein